MLCVVFGVNVGACFYLSLLCLYSNRCYEAFSLGVRKLLTLSTPLSEISLNCASLNAVPPHRYNICCHKVMLPLYTRHLAALFALF